MKVENMTTPPVCSKCGGPAQGYIARAIEKPIDSAAAMKGIREFRQGEKVWFCANHLAEKQKC